MALRDQLMTYNNDGANRYVAMAQRGSGLLDGKHSSDHRNRCSRSPYCPTWAFDPVNLALLGHDASTSLLGARSGSSDNPVLSSGPGLTDSQRLDHGVGNASTNDQDVGEVEHGVPSDVNEVDHLT